MADPLTALGAIAAGAQIIHYGYKGLTATPALSHRIRHHSDQIQIWSRDLARATQLLDKVEQSLPVTSPIIREHFEACREHTTNLDTLLRPVTAISKTRKIDFVLRKTALVEAHFSSFRASIGMLFAVTSLLAPDYPTGLSQGSPLLTHRHHERVIHDVIVLLAQFHSSAVPLALVSNIINKSYLDEVLIHLQSQSLITIALSTRTLTLNQSEWHKVCSKLVLTGKQPKFLISVLRSLDEHFPTEFSRPLCFRQSMELEKHVLHALQLAMNLTATQRLFEQTAHLAYRYCVFLIVAGEYLSAVTFITQYLTWSRDQLTTHTEEAIAFVSKQSVAELMRGSGKNSWRLSRAVAQDSINFYGATSLEVSHSLNNLALIHHTDGQNDKAMKYHRKALAYKESSVDVGKDHPDTLVSVNNLGVVLHSQGRYARAEELFGRALTGWSQAFGADDLFVLTAQSNMAIAAAAQDRLTEAEALHRQVLAKRQRLLGSFHHDTLRSRANLAHTMGKRGQRAIAEVEFREILKRFQDDRNLGPSHPDTLRTYTNLAYFLAGQTKYKEAEAIIAESLPLIQSPSGRPCAAWLVAMETRAILLQHLRDFATAAEVAGRVYEGRLITLGFQHSETKKSFRHLRGLQRDLEASLVTNCSAGRRMAIVA